MSRSCLAVILAAGDSSRMKSSKSKVLHTIGGLPIISHIVNTATKAETDHVALIVGRDAEKVHIEASKSGASVSVHQQTERLGTAHAVLQARDEIAKGYDDVLALVGDAPLIGVDILNELRQGLADGADVVVAGFEAADPFGYGRMIVKDGALIAIVEEKETSDAQKQITFCNGGLIAMNGKTALEMLELIGNDNIKGEYYLTDIVEVCQKMGKKSIAITAPEADLMGCNTRSELSEIEAAWQSRKREELMLSGVTMIDPTSVYLSHDTAIGQDTVLEPNVWIGPGVTIENDVQILAFSHLEGATIGANAIIGPFARLRPGADLGQNTKVGNFCEVKKAKVGKGSKINHLSYIGDAFIGEGVNVGAGTITCNYDGFIKHVTQIGDNSFIGSNSSLVAPLKIGAGALIGSGTVVTKTVGIDDLAVTRVPQQNIKGLAVKIRNKNAALKKARQSKAK
jgi:bifunctional UDP-N-acetylglucosamine pyrophosphorylase/glucosamine-1-phosphate N-acetyltransferase